MVLDLPPESPGNVAVVVVADAGQAKKPVAAVRTLGVCKPMPNRPDDLSRMGRAGLPFAASAANYLYYYEGKQIDYRDSVVTLLEPPSHGEMTEIVKGSASYKPARGFAGHDRIVALVELAGYQVKVVYFIKVQADTAFIPDDEETIKKYCGPKGDMWKISLPAVSPGFDNSNQKALLAAGAHSWHIDYTPYLSDVRRGPTNHSTGPARKAAQAGEFKR